jgi:hypothetical protein
MDKTSAIDLRDKRDGLVAYIWDAYKDLNGIRPRWINFDAMSLEELEAEANSLSDAIGKEVAVEREHTKRVLAIKNGTAEGVLVLDPYYDLNDPIDARYIADSEAMGDYRHYSIYEAPAAPKNESLAEKLKAALSKSAK